METQSTGESKLHNDDTTPSDHAWTPKDFTRIQLPYPNFSGCCNHQEQTFFTEFRLIRAGQENDSWQPAVKSQ